MMIKGFISAMNKHAPVFVMLVVASGLVGCSSSEPTNAPTKQAVEDANVKRAAAVDADPNMSPAQKAKMKEMMGITKPAQGGATPPSTSGK